jgi:small subunit ribosomal protein S2
MALPAFSMRELIDAGVHFGHKTKRWNPRMAPFIYGTRNDVHIIDLQQTVPLLHRALGVVRSTVLKNGRILFVGTKRQAADSIVEAAQRCGQYYVNNRWLGGMLTNWQTIQGSIRQLRKYEELLAQENSGLTKKERLTMQRDRDKLERSLGGIRDMGGKPDLLVVIDTNREELAIKEAQKLGIPIVAIIDTNCSADGIDYPIPGNDDATRAIKLYCKLISDAALDGLQESLGGRSAPAKKASSEMEEALNAVPVEAKEEKSEAKPARSGKGKQQQQPAKAPVKSSSKKEAFAEEAKKAASKKEGGEADVATAKKAKAKKSA